MSEPSFDVLYVPLPSDLWAQAAYLTMRPSVVREQASAMLVRVAQMIAEHTSGGSAGMEGFAALPEEKQAWVLGLVRNVLVRFGATER
jgi:hypothetical protein